MKPLLKSFKIFIKQIANDNMLIVVSVTPILAALFFKFAVPYIENLLCGYFNTQAVLADYYLLFDLLLCLLTPFMFCFVSAMVMLTEYDENMSVYMTVTPLGKKGYIVSRLIIPAIISMFLSMIIVACFCLTHWTFYGLFTISALSSIFSVVIALLIFSISHNRVEGMAMSKIAGIAIIGLPVPFFLTNGVQYLFAFLPSFWIAKISVNNNYIFIFSALITLAFWLILLYRKFVKKLN